MTDGNRISVRLVGADEDDGIVRFDDFRNFCDSLAACLRKSEELLTSGPTRIRYRIVGLENASAAVTLEAIAPTNGRDPRPEVLGLFRETVVNLQSGRPVDSRIGRDVLAAYRELISPLHRRTKEVWVDSSCLTTQYGASIDEILGSSIPSEGSVRGVLERVNVHNRNEFVLYPPLPGYSVSCSFPDSMLEQVRRAIKSNVTVWGRLHFQPDAPFPHQVHASRMEIHPPDDELPTFSDLRGTAKECTGTLTSVAFVRAVRDEQAD
ncbi:MAG: hypothetical protein NTW96_23120 [Planctomycetia bacterium]|nr:hypothetical protein [Planctomycetia bacterium]